MYQEVKNVSFSNYQILLSLDKQRWKFPGNWGLVWEREEAKLYLSAPAPTSEQRWWTLWGPLPAWSGSGLQKASPGSLVACSPH